MEIRTATMADLPRVAAVEAACFPSSGGGHRGRVCRQAGRYIPITFGCWSRDGELISFINGMVSDEPDLRDEMYADASLHNEAGAWQMIFGVNTMPQYRRQGMAARVMERVIADAKAQGRKGCVLTCKDRLVHYYETFGFRSEGVSDSTHGGVVWYAMRLTF